MSGTPVSNGYSRYSRAVGEGRHRADPKGHGHYLAAALGVFLFVALLAGGGYTLHGALTTRPETPAASLSNGPEGATPAPSSSIFAQASPDASTAPTLALRVVGKRCYVRVETPEGRVLLDRTLTQGEQFTKDSRELKVTVMDSSAVEIFVNGDKRKLGEQGIETFTASRDEE